MEENITLKLELKDAVILNIKSAVGYIGRSRRGYTYHKYTVSDPNYGRVWFSSSSKFLWEARKGDKISCEVNAYARSTPTEKWPERMIFAKKATKITLVKVDATQEQNVTPIS